MKTIFLKTWKTCLLLLMMVSIANASNPIKIAETSNKGIAFTINSDLILKAINSAYFNSNDYTAKSAVIIKDQDNYYLICKAYGSENAIKFVFDLETVEGSLYLVPKVQTCVLGNNCARCAVDSQHCACSETNSGYSSGTCYWSNVEGHGLTFMDKLDFLIKNIGQDQISK